MVERVQSIEAIDFGPWAGDHIAALLEARGYVVPADIRDAGERREWDRSR